MTIYNITLIAETPKAYLLSWYDTNYKGRVRAWVPRSLSHLENGTLFIDTWMYTRLKLTRVSKGQ